MDDIQRPTPGPLMPDGAPMRCVDCLGYMGNGPTGVCRGAPPTPFQTAAIRDAAGGVTIEARASLYPVVSADGWCLAFYGDRQRVRRDWYLAVADAALGIETLAEGNA